MNHAFSLVSVGFKAGISRFSCVTFSNLHSDFSFFTFKFIDKLTSIQNEAWHRFRSEVPYLFQCKIFGVIAYSVPDLYTLVKLLLHFPNILRLLRVQAHPLILLIQNRNHIDLLLVTLLVIAYFWEELEALPYYLLLLEILQVFVVVQGALLSCQSYQNAKVLLLYALVSFLRLLH